MYPRIEGNLTEQQIMFKGKGTMKSYVFKVVVEDDNCEDGTPAFHVYCPTLPSASTWGYTRAEALKNIQEVVELVVESMVKDGELIPEHDSNVVTVSPEPLVVVNV